MEKSESERIWEAIKQLQEEMNQIHTGRPLTTPKKFDWMPPKSPGMKQSAIKQTTLDDFSMPVWSAKEWENWAKDIYNQYPQMKEYLPDWFIKKMQR